MTKMIINPKISSQSQRMICNESSSSFLISLILQSLNFLAAQASYLANLIYFVSSLLHAAVNLYEASPIISMFLTMP